MITFETGNDERHSCLFNYNTMTGAVKIAVDNKEISSSNVLFIGRTLFTFQIGNVEKHDVKIELENPPFFAIRGSTVKIIVDEQLIRQDHVGGNIFIISLIILIPSILYIVLALISGR